MKTINLLLPCLLLLGGVSAFTPPEVFSVSVVDDEFDKLNTEYTTAKEAWEAEVEVASDEAQAELAKARPVIVFWTRFETLSNTGDGQATLWLVNNMSVARVVKSEDRSRRLHALFSELTGKHVSAPWLGEALGALFQASRALGTEVTLELYERVITGTTLDENRAGALFHAGSLMKASPEEDVVKRGEAYIVRIEKELSGTSWITRVRDLRAWESVQPGGQAPNFKGKTLDGFEFELEEYRGKVVLLDFFGFW